MSELKLPDFFPRTSKKCIDTSNNFFKCYSDESLKPEALSPLNPNSGKESLLKCKSLLEAYENCMKKDKNVKIPQEYRVS